MIYIYQFELFVLYPICIYKRLILNIIRIDNVTVLLVTEIQTTFTCKYLTIFN